MKGKNLPPRLLYPAKLSFTVEGHIKSFSNKKKLKELIITKPVTQETLKSFFKDGRGEWVKKVKGLKSTN